MQRSRFPLTGCRACSSGTGLASTCTASRCEASFLPSDSETRGFWASSVGVLRPREPGAPGQAAHSATSPLSPTG